MAVFGKAKEQLEFVKKAREIQKKLQIESFTAESGAVTVVFNGEQKLQKVILNKDDVDINKLEILEKDIKTAVDSAIKKSQDFAANLMKEIGGFPGM